MELLYQLLACQEDREACEDRGPVVKLPEHLSPPYGISLLDCKFEVYSFEGCAPMAAAHKGREGEGRDDKQREAGKWE